ncbi:MAG: hypothetical protein K5866_11610 [Treponema sp.]|nr:hypothetical protein [Treponema sp.]
MQKDVVLSEKQTYSISLLFDEEAGGNRNYLAENYFPHLGLAVKLTPGQFEKAFKLKVDFPKKAVVKALSLSLCHPYCEIRRIDF